MKSYHAKTSDCEQKWYIVDLKDQILGRTATKIATVLRGKHLPQYTPSRNMQQYVVVVNADHVQMTGNKWDAKKYYSHTGYMGRLKQISAKDQLKKDSSRIIREAVKGMLPSGPLGRQQIKHLKIYPGVDHPHGAQNPQVLK